MGDRANVYLVDSDVEHGMYVYTHWSGSELPEMVREALEKAEHRWGDAQYAARIFVSQFFSDIHEEETGGGLSTVMWDNQHPLIVVHLPLRRVYLAQVGEERSPVPDNFGYTFENFVGLKHAEWDDLS